MAAPSYADFVKLRVQRNPCVRGLSQHLAHPFRGKSRIVFLEYLHNGVYQSAPEPRELTDQECVMLTAHIPPSTTYLLLVENISPGLIEQIGKALDLDPLFFANYVITDFQDIEKAPPPPSLALLPSLIAQRGDLHLHYQQALDMGNVEHFTDAAYVLKTDSNVPRNVRRLAPLGGRQLGLARASCSILVKKIGTSFVCLFLVDPPITHVVESPGTIQRRIYGASAIYSGFEDFGPGQPFSLFAFGRADDAWDKRSMLDSIVHYFRTQPPPGFLAPSPSIISVSYYPIYIVLSEWNLYTHLISRYSKYYEYSLQDITSRLHNNDIIDLQRWRRRCKQSRNKLALLADFIHHWAETEENNLPWRLMLQDISYLRQQLQDYSQSLEQMMTIAITMIQLLDSRRSILEAINVRRLTYVALVFVPLAWVASLFSMSETYLPGHEYFWVYFATALPLVALVLLLSALSYDRLMRVLKKG